MKIKKAFVTGLIILAPLALTFAILLFIFNFLTVPFVGAVTAIFDNYNIMKNGFLFISGPQLQTIVGQIFVLIALFFITVSIGAIARYFFFKSLIRMWDYSIQKIPFISTIYKASQDVIKTVFGSKTNSFKQVVVVPFPSKNTYAIGLVTNDDIEGLIKEISLVSVFVPTAPNPTSGFLMLYKPEDLVYLDMKVEDAFKYVISCGMILSPFDIIDRKRALELEKERGQK